MKLIDLNSGEREFLHTVVSYIYNNEESKASLYDILNDLLLMCSSITLLHGKAYYGFFKVEQIEDDLDQLFYYTLVSYGINPTDYKLVNNPYGTHYIQKIINE